METESVPATGRSVAPAIYSTCPQSKDHPPKDYLRRVEEISRWSERQGCRGMLIYSDNSLIDPWLLAQRVICETDRLAPLVALQPVYQHPYSAAKMVATLGYLYARRVDLNMIAGGFRNDLEALGDQAPHDLRYERLIEYTTILRALLAGDSAVTFEGDFYSVRNLRLQPQLAPDLMPEVLVSGSSAAGQAAALAMEATAIHYPRPAADYEAARTGARAGIRVGIIARDDSAQAWSVARKRFPADRRGQLTHELAMKISDSDWHRQLSHLAVETSSGETPYWLLPFLNYRTFCPYLVGSYVEVAGELKRYLSAGFSTFILDIPPEEEELAHANCAFRRAIAEVYACQYG